MEPNPYDSQDVRGTELWVVWRIDDNGNTFQVQDGLVKEAAERLVEEFTSRGHKQTYWAEKSKTS